MLTGYHSLKKRKVVRSIALVCLADGVVGMSYGAVAVSSGFELWIPLSLSILVIAGASEFLFIGILASGGSPLAAALAGLLVNARHIPFGMTVKDLVGRGPMGYLGCHLMNDETVVFGISQATEEERKTAYWLCGLGILLMWPLGVFLGGILGSVIEDTSTLGLDAMFPAILIALVVPTLNSAKKILSAVSGALVTVVTTPFFPAGLPALLSLSGVLLGRKIK